MVKSDMFIHIGLFIYLLVKSCSTMGYVAYPLDDSNKKDHRILSVCTDYGKEQTKEIYLHEVMHACLHDHSHHFSTKKELEEHLSIIPEKSEEAFVSSFSACVDQALENKDVNNFYGIK